MRNYFKPLVLGLSLSGLMLGTAHAKEILFTIDNRVSAPLFLYYKIGNEAWKRAFAGKNQIPVLKEESVLVRITTYDGKMIRPVAVKLGTVNKTYHYNNLNKDLAIACYGECFKAH